MKTVFSLIFGCVVSALLAAGLVLSVDVSSERRLALRVNESEVLAFASLQSISMPSLKAAYAGMIKESMRYQMVDGLFLQQKEIQPAEGELQLPNFGATTNWSNILDLVADNSSRRLVIMIRHAQAWENLNPDGNDKCEFILNGETINNFDSPLSNEGAQQGKQLHDLLSSPAPGSKDKRTWFETIGLSSAAFFTSPLMRTMQTSELAFTSLTSNKFIVSEIIRASIGKDVCNYRHSIRSPTSHGALPDPWSTRCTLPDESLTDLFGHSPINFEFSIRPQGGSGIGLISDSDMLWRNDVEDDTLVSRALVFLGQLFDQPNPIALVVTHGEMVDAMYKAAGVHQGYDPRNTQVVPMVVELKQ